MCVRCRVAQASVRRSQLFVDAPASMELRVSARGVGADPRVELSGGRKILPADPGTTLARGFGDCKDKLELPEIARDCPYVDSYVVPTTKGPLIASVRGVVDSAGDEALVRLRTGDLGVARGLLAWAAEVVRRDPAEPHHRAFLEAMRLGGQGSPADVAAALLAGPHSPAAEEIVRVTSSSAGGTPALRGAWDQASAMGSHAAAQVIRVQGRAYTKTALTRRRGRPRRPTRRRRPPWGSARCRSAGRPRRGPCRSGRSGGTRGSSGGR